jgi:Spy/CpxP family protein refolding chaperone
MDLDTPRHLQFASALANCYSEIAHALADRAANRNPLSHHSRKGSAMKLTIRNAHEEWREPVEKETHRQAAKLEKLLKRYSPDLVNLHADIEKHARKESYTFTLMAAATLSRVEFLTAYMASSARCSSSPWSWRRWGRKRRRCWP